MIRGIMGQAVRDGIGAVGMPASQLGPNVIANGTFDTDTVWVKPGAECTISGGTASWDGTQLGTSSMTQDAMAIDCIYFSVYDILGRTAGLMTIFAGAGAAGTARNADGTYREVVGPQTPGTSLILNANIDFNGSVDNVIARAIL